MGDWAGAAQRRGDVAAFRTRYRGPTQGMANAVRRFVALARNLDDDEMQDRAGRWAIAGAGYVRAVRSVNSAILSRDEARRRIAMKQLETAALPLAALSGPHPDIEIVD